MRLVKKNLIIKSIYNALIAYPVPLNISYFWNFGISAGILLFCQIITGIILAMYYVPSADLAFVSVRHIINDVDYGAMIRMYHASGSSLFFLLYICIFLEVYIIVLMHIRDSLFEYLVL